MTAPAVPTGRNLLPSPNSAGDGWSGSGSAAAGGNPAATFTPAVSITGMDRPIAGRLAQGGLTANGRIGVEQFVSPTDLDGLPFSLSVQIEADPTPQRCTNPVCASNVTGWSGSGGYTAAQATGLSGMVATTGYRITKATSAAAMFLYSEAVAVTVGETVTGALQGRPSAATTLTWYLAWFNSSGTQIATTTGAAVSAAANSTTNRAVSGVAPSGAVTCRVVIGTASVAVGVTLTATGARIDGVADPSASDGSGGMLYGAALSCALELAFLDVSGARIGAVITGTTATIASGGAPVRAYAQGTAPTGCRRVAVTALYRSLAARQRVYATLARCDQVSDAALVGADGSTTGWGWDGVAERSSSGPVEDGENACSNPEARSNLTGSGGGWTFSGPAGSTGTYVSDAGGLTCSSALRVTQGATAGNVWSYAPYFTPGRDMGGETWTVVLEGLISAAVSASVQLVPYDGAGQLLSGTVTGSAVSVTAGGVMRQVVTSTLPAGTRRIRAALLSRSLPADATVTATAARYRRGSWPSMVFAGGYSRGWGWDVREGGTSRRQLPAEWKAATDGTTASSVGTSIGYDTTQYQPGPPAGSSTTQPIQTGGTPIPVEAAPFGRPGRATKNTIGENVQRWEHNPSHRSFDVGDDVFFSTAFALGGDFPLDANDFQIVEQIHQAWGSWSPPVAFEVRQGGLYLTGGNGLPNGNSTGNPQEFAHFQRLADLQRERWYSLVYRIANFSEATGGSELWVWLDDVLILDDWTIPCPTIVQGDASTRLSYRKQGFYHRPSLPGGTVWHAGAAMGNNYAAVDPARTPLFTTHAGAATLTSGTTVTTPAPRLGAAAAAALTSGTTVEPAGTRQTSGAAAALTSGTSVEATVVARRAASAQLTSGTTVALGGYSTRQATALLTSGTSLSIYALTLAAAALTSGTAVAVDGSVGRSGAATLTSGTMVYAAAERLDAVGVRLTSGTTALVVGHVRRAAAAELSSGTTVVVDGRREVVVRPGVGETNPAILSDGPTFYATGEPGPDAASGRSIWASPAGTETYQAGPRGGSAFAVRNTRYRGVNGGGWLSTPQVSVEAWLYVPNPAAGSFQNLVDTRSNPAGTWAGWQLYLNPTGTLTFSAGVGAGQGGVTAPTPIPAGVWMHVAATCDGPTRRLYINGELAGQSVVAAGYSPVEQSTNLRFGVSVNHDGAALDDIAVYDYPLTAEQVAAHYNAVPTPTPGLLLASGTTVQVAGATVRAASVRLSSGTAVEVAAATVRAAAAVLASGTSVGARADGPVYLLSGTTVEVAGPRQAMSATVALTSGTAVTVGAAVVWAAARLTSGTVVSPGGHVERAAAAALTSGTRVLVAALGPERGIATALLSGTTVVVAATAARPISGPIRLTSGTMLYADVSVYQPVFVAPRPGKLQTPAPSLRLLVASATTGRIGWELPASDLKWNSPLNKIGTATATLEVDDVLESVYEQGARDPFAELNDVFSAPLKNLLLITLGGGVVWGGPLMPADEPEDGSALTIAAAEFRRLLEYRYARAAGVAHSVPWAAAARDLTLSSTNPRGAIRALVDNATTGTPPSGASRWLPWWTSQTVDARGDESFTWLSHAQDTTSKAIDDITKRADGPDVRFDPALWTLDGVEHVFFDLRIGTPYLDTAGAPWVFDESDCRFSRRTDPGGIGTDFWTPGSGQDRDKQIGFGSDPTLGRLGWPALEVVDTQHTAKDDQGELDRYARGRAAAGARGPSSWKVTAPIDGDPGITQYRTGEMALFPLRRHLSIPPGDYLRRVTNIDGDLSGRVTLTCDEDNHDLTGV